jgi:hypothetical protein
LTLGESWDCLTRSFFGHLRKTMSYQGANL